MQFKRTNIPYNGRDKYTELGGGLKFKKVTKSYGTASGGFGGGGIGPLPVTPPTASTIEVGLEILNTNIAYEDITADGYVVGIPIVGFADNDNTEVWVGGLSSGQTNYSISGVCSGMSVSVVNNGTIEPKLNVTFRNTMTQMSGELLIPVTVNNRTYLEAWSATTDNWAAMTEKKAFPQRILIYSWNIKTSGGGTGYVFDLSNENATVNADSNGNIYTASTATLACTATLYYNNIVETGATYAITATTATGVSINSTTGVLTFANNFTFTGYSCTIDITATVGGVVKGNKTMRITKVKDGADGTGGVSRWIVPSVNVTVLGIDSSVTPSVVTAVVMKQTSGNAPEVDTGTTIYYGYSPGQLNPTITMPGTGVTIDPSVEYLVLALREGNVYNGTIYEQETIHMIAEGTGPTIRGPIRWRTQLARRFANGTGPQLSDREFIDVVRYGVHTYRCTTSYTQTSGSTWSSVSENWTLDDSYNFIASQVDLAQNEAIYIRPDNMIEFHNSQDGVVGRLTTSTMFYGASSYQNAPIKITNAGNIYGTNINSTNVTATGTIEGVTIKKNTGHQKNMIAMFAPYEMSINFVHDDADKDDFIQEIDGTWYVNGNAIVEAEVFQYLRLVDSEDEFHRDLAGNYILSNSYEPSEEEEYMLTGVVASDIVRESNIIYITI